MSALHINDNKRYSAPHSFMCAPSLNMGMTSGALSAYVDEPLTPTTGAELRALADQADALWAEYEASRKGSGVRA